MAFHLEHVVKSWSARANPFKKAVRMNLVQRKATAIIRGINDRHLGGIRT